MGMRSTHGEEGGEKRLVGAKEQRKRLEEHTEGTGGSQDCADIWAAPRLGPALPLPPLLGAPPARDGRRWNHSPAQLGGAGHNQLHVGAQAASCSVLSLAGGCWGRGWALELSWQLKQQTETLTWSLPAAHLDKANKTKTAGFRA